MKILKLYETLMREERIEACERAFGDELFAPQLGGEEPNTDVEKDYLELIRKFTKFHHGPRINPEFITAVGNLKRCVSMFPDVLYPSGMAYRGEKLTLYWLLHNFDQIKESLRSGTEFELTYASKSPIQSWTDDIEVAQEFASVGPTLQLILNRYRDAKENGTLPEYLKKIKDTMMDTGVPIIISYMTTPDDFLFKSEYFSLLSQHPEENEILRVDNRPIRVKAKIYPNSISAAMFKFLSDLKSA